MPLLTVTRTVIANGELVNEQTFLVTDLTEVEQVGSLPFEASGLGLMGGLTIDVTFRFDPPLVIPSGDEPPR